MNPFRPFWQVAALMVGGVCLFMAVLVVAVNLTARHYDHVRCNGFATRTGRPTRFVVYSFWQWDCLTPSGEGRWIPIEQLRQFGAT